MRLVVDTNVFVSAALKQTSWPAFVLRWLTEYGVLLKSAATEAELFAVLQRPRIARKIAPAYLTGLHTLFRAAEQIEPAIISTNCRDPADEKFLALALSGHADLIISGDADLLVMENFHNIPIISPATFGTTLCAPP